MIAVFTAFAVALLIAAPITLYARRHRPRGELVVIGRDVTVPRSAGMPTAYRRERKDAWPC